jgi:hypothetical protein
MIERINAPGLSQPPGYLHVVLASGTRLVTTAGAVPLDAEGNLVGAGDLLLQAGGRSRTWRQPWRRSARGSATS